MAYSADEEAMKVIYNNTEVSLFPTSNRVIVVIVCVEWALAALSHA